MSETEKALNLVETFLMAFYHQQDDLAGTTRALSALRPEPAYRRDLAYAFKYLLVQELTVGMLRTLVRDAANRDVKTDEEARDYLKFLYHDNLLYLEIDIEDED